MINTYKYTLQVGKPALGKKKKKKALICRIYFWHTKNQPVMVDLKLVMILHTMV